MVFLCNIAFIIVILKNVEILYFQPFRNYKCWHGSVNMQTKCESMAISIRTISFIFPDECKMLTLYFL